MKADQTFEETRATRVISQQIPTNIDFGLCAVSQPEARNFRLINLGTSPVEFSFAPCAFEIEPNKGVLEPNVNFPVSFSICFSEARAIIAKTTLKVTNEAPAVIKISAVGKYPYCSFSSKEIDFGQIAVGLSEEGSVELLNQSEVGATFEVERLKDDDFDDMAIAVKENEGFVPVGKAFILRFSFQPIIPDFFSSARFRVKVKGGNEGVVELRGVCKKSSGSFDRSMIIFPDLKVGDWIEESLVLSNVVGHPITFEFGGLPAFFKVSRQRGTIAAGSQVKLRIRFSPGRPAHYFHRLFCLVKDKEALFVDLYGGGHELITRPLPLSLFILGQLPPDKAEAVRNEIKTLPSSFPKFEKTALAEEKQHDIRLPSLKKKSNLLQRVRLVKVPGAPALTAPSEPGLTAGVLSSLLAKPKTSFQLEGAEKTGGSGATGAFELFFGSAASSVFELSDESLDFGATTSERPIWRELQIRNKLSGELHFEFQSTTGYFGTEGRLVVKGGETETIRVNFRPNAPFQLYADTLAVTACTFAPLEFTPGSRNRSANQFFYEELEKENCFESAEEDKEDGEEGKQKGKVFALTGATVPLIGHSFVDGAQAYIPMLKFSPAVLRFVPLKLGEVSHLTLSLANSADTPTIFSAEGVPECFAVRPRVGLIPPRSFCLLAIRFAPKEQRLYSEELVLRLNGAHRRRVLLKGHCLSSSLEFQNGGKLYFPPSGLGVRTTLPFRVRNAGRQKCSLSLTVPEKYARELSIEPPLLRLAPYEEAEVAFSFAPLRKQRYRIKVAADCDGLRVPGIEVIGEGGDGELELFPPVLDFKIVTVDFVKSGKILLRNPSKTLFRVRLEVLSEPSDPALLSYLSVNFSESVIPARSQTEILVEFRPKSICSYNVTLNLWACGESPDASILDDDRKSEHLKATCLLNLQANFPVLKIIDIRNNELSLSSLWEKFELNRVNSELSTSLSEFERKFSHDRKALFNPERSLNCDDRRFTWDFGYIHAKEKEKQRRAINMVFQNIGGTDLEWEIVVEDKTFDSEGIERRAMNLDKLKRGVLSEHNSFVIRPKSGKLAPGEKKKVVVTYYPSIDDEALNKNGDRRVEEEHFLSAFLAITNGKTIQVNMKGKTLSAVQGKIMIKSNIIKLPILPIDFPLAVMVPVGLFNMGSNTLKFSVNRKKFFEENPSAEGVIDFLGEEGSLLALEKKFLCVTFKPNRVGQINYKVTLHVYDFMKEIQVLDFSLSGEGFRAGMFPPSGSFFQVEDGIEAEMQVLSPGDNVAYLSQETLDFRDLEYGKTHSRVIVLFNNSLTDKCAFKFLNFRGILSDEFDIFPESGELEPRERVLVVFSISQNFPPCFWEGEINCSIKWIPKNAESFGQTIPNSTSTPPVSSFAEKKELAEPIDKSSSDMIFLRVKKSFNIPSVSNLPNSFLLPEKQATQVELGEMDQGWLPALFEQTIRNTINTSQFFKKVLENEEDDYYPKTIKNDIELFNYDQLVPSLQGDLLINDESDLDPKQIIDEMLAISDEEEFNPFEEIEHKMKNFQEIAEGALKSALGDLLGRNEKTEPVEVSRVFDRQPQTERKDIPNVSHCEISNFIKVFRKIGVSAMDK